MLIQSDAELRVVLDLLTVDGATPGPYDAAIVALFQNDFFPNANQVVGDFTEADFDGYAQSTAAVWGDAITDVAGETAVYADTKQFTATGGVTTNTIYGYYVLDSTATKVLWAERFEDPVIVTAAGQGVVVVPKYAMGRAA